MKQLMLGNAAVGKMTVGQELCKITPFRLFHNHMTIEPVIEIFGTLVGYNRVRDRLRQVIFEEFAAADQYGLIFTFMWAFDEPGDWEYVESVKAIFEKVGAEIYYVELVAPQEVRLQRNETENRLAHKASKRDLEASRWRLLHDDERHRCVSEPGEITFPNYIKIDNTALSPEETALRIKEHFSFASAAGTDENR